MLLNRHILFRNGYYYYRHVIPNDLKGLIPFREIKQSLKTNNRTIAECQALIIEGNVQRVFSLIRSGIASQETISQLLEPIIPQKKNKPASLLKFSQLISLYIRNEEKGWTQKTLMEVNGVRPLCLKKGEMAHT
jgi:methionyl-tRNA synthetase